MEDALEERRVAASPRTGTRLSIVVGIVCVIWAAYAVLAPLSVSARTGARFDCRSAVQGPKTELARSTCGAVYTSAKIKAATLLATGLVIGVGGALTFGVTRREERVVTLDRAARDDEED